MFTSLITLILVFFQFIVVMYVLFLLTKISDSLETISKTLSDINHRFYPLSGGEAEPKDAAEIGETGGLEPPPV